MNICKAGGVELFYYFKLIWIRLTLSIFPNTTIQSVKIIQQVSRTQNHRKLGKLRKFPKWLDIWEISLKPRHLGYSWNFPNSYMPRHLGNFPDSQAFWVFPKFPGIWEIPRYPDISEIPRYPVVWKISQILLNFENFPNSKAFGEFLKYFKYTTIRFQQEFWEFEEFSRFPGISEFPRHPGS